MTAKSPAIEADVIERDIVGLITAAKLRLRFDKAVLRLVGSLKAALANVIPEEQTVIFTITAPIRLPAKTAATLENLVRNGVPDGERREAVYGNQVRIRWLTGVPTHMPKVLGFVHNRESDAGLILALAEARLLEQD